MEKKKVLIVDDDPICRDLLEKIVGEIDELAICYKAPDIKQAYEILHKNVIDVFIIDIILDTTVTGDVSGIKLAEEIRAIDRYAFTPVLFITGMLDPKLYAYSELHIFKYIEKPFRIEDIMDTIKDALRYKTELEKEKFLHFRKDGVLFPVKENSVVYMESKGHMLYIHTTKERITIPYISCRKMLTVLDERWFVQCSKSVIVNRKYIVNIDTVNRYIALKSGCLHSAVSIGKRYLDKVLEGVVVC